VSTRRPFKKEWHRYAEDLSGVLQPTGAHPIDTLLVLLHLLKGKAERLAQFLLAHAEHHAAHAQPAADVLVDGIWIPRAHLTPEFGGANWRGIFEGIVREDKRYRARVARQFAAQAFPGPNRTRLAEAGMIAPLGLPGAPAR
jgi:hypothetical protein